MKSTFLRRTLLLSILCVSCSIVSFSQQFKVLLFTKTDGFHHESIQEGVAAVRQLASRNNFTVDWQENASIFNDKALENYKVVIFLNTTGNVLDEKQQAAFEKFIKAGKGYVGIHSASDTEYEWPWYTKMVGMMFKIHPQQQTAYLTVEDSNFPGMERFPKRLLWTDEWYEYGDRKTDDLHILVTVDEKTYDPNTKWG
ncbi:MAG: ThuA domain-containing protein, partial [Chitinophagaceae bacterium]|nr:ThuA domain-containing protein [Chitinophagaceae bacterium]